MLIISKFNQLMFHNSSADLPNCGSCISIFFDHYLKMFLSFKAISLSLNFSFIVFDRDEKTMHVHVDMKYDTNNRL